MVTPEREPDLALKALLALVACHPRPGALEEPSLARRAKAGDQCARDRMVLGHLYLVAQEIAHTRSHADIDEMIQEGCLALLRVLERFDPAREARFGTYATRFVRAAITNAGTAGGGTTGAPLLDHTPSPEEDILSAIDAPIVRLRVVRALLSRPIRDRSVVVSRNPDLADLEADLTPWVRTRSKFLLPGGLGTVQDLSVHWGRTPGRISQLQERMRTWARRTPLLTCVNPRAPVTDRPRPFGMILGRADVRLVRRFKDAPDYSLGEGVMIYVRATRQVDADRQLNRLLAGLLECGFRVPIGIPAVTDPCQGIYADVGPIRSIQRSAFDLMRFISALIADCEKRGILAFEAIDLIPDSLDPADAWKVLSSLRGRGRLPIARFPFGYDRLRDRIAPVPRRVEGRVPPTGACLTSLKSGADSHEAGYPPDSIA